MTLTRRDFLKGLAAVVTSGAALGCAEKPQIVKTPENIFIVEEGYVNADFVSQHGLRNAYITDMQGNIVLKLVENRKPLKEVCLHNRQLGGYSNGAYHDDWETYCSFRKRQDIKAGEYILVIENLAGETTKIPSKK